MEYINEKDMKDLEGDVESLILGWLKDYEVVENVTSFQEESKKVAKIIAEMIPRWDNFAEEYRDETEEYDNSDYEYEVRAGK
jgi:chloramphenicol O-acetyltransferase